MRISSSSAPEERSRSTTLPEATGQPGGSTRWARAASWIDGHQTLIVGLLAIAAVLVSLIPRWTQLGAQSVWTDEQFTLGQTSGTLKNLRQVGHYEIHTPFFASVLWIWNHIVAFGAVRARSFSALITSLAILAVPLMLRRSPLAPTTRWLLAAAVATSGLGFVYGQEIRSYGLLWALSVALTCSHIRIDLAGPGRSPVEGTASRHWGTLHLLLGVLASLTHLFGLVLAAASIVVLMARGRIRPLRGLIGLGVTALPEAIWIIHGTMFVPKFAAGADWNDSPGLDAVNQLFQDVFAWGRPSMADGGFVWHSPAGLWLAIAVLLVALNRFWSRPRATRGRPTTPALRASISLSLLVLLVIAASWLGSQIVPLWTPRNLIIVDPAIRMALALFLVAAVRTTGTRTLVSGALIVLMALSLGSVASANRHPWKTDYRAAIRLAEATRQNHPGVQIAGNINPHWAFGNVPHPNDP